MTSLRPLTYTNQAAPLRSRSTIAADGILLVAVVVIFWMLIVLSQELGAPFDASTAPSTVSTDPAQLPFFVARSLLRMFAALAVSLLFTFVYATAAARSRRAEKILVPVLDILQSVPVLGFLSVTLTMWLALFPHAQLGIECASIFAIFTSQAWNMTFAFYQSLTSQPKDLDEAARVMRLTKWQRFWTLDVPHGMIPLVWNGMMSFGGGWFFLVASEVISVNNHVYALPGVGSYIAAAANNAEIDRLILAIAVMIAMVIGVNVLFWRPLTAWAERFRTGDTAAEQIHTSLVLTLTRHSRLPGTAARMLRPLGRALDVATRLFGITSRPLQTNTPQSVGDKVFFALALALIATGLLAMLNFIATHTGLSEFSTAAALGMLTFGRVVVLLIIGTLVWVPVGVWIGLNPGVARCAQPIVQVLASFPANVLFPFATLALYASGISLDWGGIVLMSLGAQWYILFNVIAGASAIPHDLREAARSLRLRHGQRWRFLYGPAVFSAWITGGITAAGGAWNASIVSELVSYGDISLRAHGLGAFIADSTAHGDFAKTLVGVTIMSVFVVGINRLFWRRLYSFADKRFSLS
ncbi:ABC transporter permease [Rathayibacter toxicus]|uniref:Sulfonate ABC transporter permease n=1 Tax=Rathayibacter toxicus TaxID=145458 RepID=A0A0C5BFX4_9MICO|nr:ABC transporter permease subunit [Rathayibacter toxicus]AJM77080.1 sulfonate ABC transporter permease [Rathayibacter toxicus]ALS57103.1 sulfonate ABC transporter permease [Rathayibacter toxicus]KKM46083.1 sulfonate ABC transporter permease [Rathayibacter toxicus]PPG23020.1 sulfonate ABC transporter permease [Rathayibacter toxicus]PPG47602.1 sulfonate ABC transporter permease [Rathayibacter toxicus]